MPVTTPDEPTVATAVLALLHDPPKLPSVSEVVAPVQKLGIPEIRVGNGFTVTSCTALQPVDVMI